VSAGHQANGDLSQAELDSLLDHALADPRVKKRLARSFKLNCDYDIALLGSSSIGGWTVYLDRHLRFKNWPYGVIPVKYKRLDVKPGLIRHERLEVILEDVFGWPYLPLAHFTAQHWEERLYKSKGFDPKEVESAFRPFIKKDSLERIIRSPTDLDQRPLLAPPRSTKIIERVNETAQKEKRTHESVKYEEKSTHKGQKCELCRHFIEARYGGPACAGVKSPIQSEAYCRRFAAGKLGDTSEGLG
jgi:hypothetical protein